MFVSFTEKLLKIVAARGEIFSLKFTKYRLAAELRPDPLGEQKRSPDPLAAIRGPTSKGREGKGRAGGRGGRRGGGTCSKVLYAPDPLNTVLHSFSRVLVNNKKLS